MSPKHASSLKPQRRSHNQTRLPDGRVLRRRGDGRDLIFSEWLSLIVKTCSSQAVKKLLNLQPEIARVQRGGAEVELPPPTGARSYGRSRPSKARKTNFSRWPPRPKHRPSILLRKPW